MGRLDHRVAIITGGAAGIGLATAQLFASEGGAVAIVDINEEAAHEAAGKIMADGGQALAVVADVTQEMAVEGAIAKTAERWGRLDILFNNAGVDVGGTVADTEEATWDRCMAVNLKSTFLCSRAAVPILERRGGSIINQASVAGLVGIPNLAPYAAAKGAVIALTRSMAIDLAVRKIRVNAICPGTVLTPLAIDFITSRGGGDFDAGMAMTVPKYPIGRLGTPEEIARVALFLAGDDSSFMTGAVLVADGGMTAQ